MADKKAWTDDMGEISGFGGGYEACCRAMVMAGIRWLDDHPDATPAFKGNDAIFGVVLEDNADAEALTKAIIDAASGEATGAMHHASVLNCLTYKRLGWEEFVRQRKDHFDEQKEADRETAQ